MPGYKAEGLDLRRELKATATLKPKKKKKYRKMLKMLSTLNVPINPDIKSS